MKCKQTMRFHTLNTLQIFDRHQHLFSLIPYKFPTGTNIFFFLNTLQIFDRHKHFFVRNTLRTFDRHQLFFLIPYNFSTSIIFS